MRYGKFKKKILAKNGLFDEKGAFLAKNGEISDFWEFFKIDLIFTILNH